MICRAEHSRLTPHILPRRRSRMARIFPLCIFAALVLGYLGTAPAQDLSKYAASPINVFGSSTTAGSDQSDGVPATSVAYPTLTVATDAAENVYFADGASLVRMIYAGGPVPLS